ncbi:MAG TPA: hypothetical protein VN873_10680 [Candidatus Angelobacter sp.]|nr:hypothetical protein [Candidatus Angelobacter sp.]
MKVFTLYVGTSQPAAKALLLQILRRRFESFTVISGEGYFKGIPEPMWFVRLAADAPQIIFETAEQIRSGLNQDIVGIEYRGNYYRYTKDDPARELKSLLGI